MRLRRTKLHYRSLHSRTSKQLTEGIPPCLVQSEKHCTSSTESCAQAMVTGASLPWNHFQVLLTQSCSDLFLWPAAQTIMSKYSRWLAHCSKLRQYINRILYTAQHVRHPISSAVHMSERTGTAVKENCFLFKQWKLVTSPLKVSCICVKQCSTPCSFLCHVAGWLLFYTILGRTMKLALRLVIQITFLSLFLRILNPGLRRQDNAAKALKTLYSLRFDGLKNVCLL